MIACWQINTFRFCLWRGLGLLYYFEIFDKTKVWNLIFHSQNRKEFFGVNLNFFGWDVNIHTLIRIIFVNYKYITCIMSNISIIGTVHFLLNRPRLCKKDVGNRKKEDCVISMTITLVSDIGNHKKRRLCDINGNNSRFRCRKP